MKITASEMLVSTDDYMRLCDECEALRNQIAVLVGQVATLTTERDELREALQELRDWQNGPPLLGPKWETGWGDAIKRADAILDAARSQ